MFHLDMPLLTERNHFQVSRTIYIPSLRDEEPQL